MKKTKSQGIFLMGCALLFVFFSSCNSSQENQTKEEIAFDQEAYNQQLQGVFEYLPPHQGLAAMFNNQFIFLYGDSDTAMVCQGGTYTTLGDNIVYTTEYASNPDLVGSVIKWTARFLENDSVKTIIYDDAGNIINELYNLRKVEVNENTQSQMQEWEGAYRYPSPSKAGGIMLGGYILYGGQLGSTISGTAAKYEHQNDTVVCKRLFTLDPANKGTSFRWVNESMQGDTLHWATINEEGEINSRGQSLFSR